MSKYHRTAIARRNFSTPVKFLLKNELFNKNQTILDYGCGRGYDVQNLASKGYNINGFDPNGQYDNYEVLDVKYNVIISNFVLNVISLPVERDAVVKDIIEHLNEGGTAYISVRNDRCVANGVTSIGTWQGFVEPTTQGWKLVTSNANFMMWEYTKERG